MNEEMVLDMEMLNARGYEVTKEDMEEFRQGYNEKIHLAILDMGFTQDEYEGIVDDELYLSDIVAK